MIRDIVGRHNHSIKLARKLQQKKHRRERGLVVCEGMDLLVAAVEAGADIRDVLVRDDLLIELPGGLRESASACDQSIGSPDIGVCDPPTLALVSSLGGAADVVFVCADPRHSLSDLDLVGGRTFFVDGVGDPGNLGTIVRSALAFGLAGVVCSSGSADAFSPKAMRAGMGAQFWLPVVTDVSHDDLAACLAGLELKGAGRPSVWVATPRGGEDPHYAGLEGPGIVVLGAERTGAGASWDQAKFITVPQERFESLNVAMAATVVAYEWWRRTSGSTVANVESVR